MEQPATHETLPPTPPPSVPPTLPPAPPPPAPRRSPGLALVLSFFPGLGHLYLGLYQRGIAVFLCFAAAIWLADHADLGILVAFVWFFGVIDAYRQAQYHPTGQPEPLAAPTVGKRSNVGFGAFLLVLGLILLYNQFYPIDFEFLVDWWPLILVGFGLYILGKHFLEQKRIKDAEARARDEEWGNQP